MKPVKSKLNLFVLRKRIRVQTQAIADESVFAGFAGIMKPRELRRVLGV